MHDGNGAARLAGRRCSGRLRRNGRLLGLRRQAVAGGVHMARVEADGDPRIVIEALQQAGQLLERATERGALPGARLQQQLDLAGVICGRVETVPQGARRAIQGFRHRLALGRAGMDHDSRYTQARRNAKLGSQRVETVPVDALIEGCKVHQVDTVDEGRAKLALRTRGAEFVDRRVLVVGRAPAGRATGKELNWSGA